MGRLLRTKRHTATGKQSQVLVAAVNRHMPATPARSDELRIKDEVTVPGDDCRGVALASGRRLLPAVAVVLRT